MNLKTEKYYWKKGYQNIIGLDEAGRGCEKIDAEILTNNGWKFYNNIQPQDKVLSYADDGYMRWQKIEKLIEKNLEGNLVELKNKEIKIIATPDHYLTVLRRVFKKDPKDNNRLKLIGYKTRKERKRITDLLNNDFIPRGGKWKGINKDFFKLPKVDKNEEKSISIKLWAAFLGIFLSEGSVAYDKKKGVYKIIVAQNENSPHYKKIDFLLKKLPFKFKKIKNGFRCDNKQLYDCLKQFGKRYTKFIPQDIKELPPPLLNILIDWMILGDGTCPIGKNRKKARVYYTGSKKLRDDFEEISLKAGWTYHTSWRAPRGGHINERTIKKENQIPCFEIRLHRNNKTQVKSLHRKEVFYKGKVFCLQLPKYHNFYVRRNGAGYFTGNSLAGPVTAAAAVVELKIKNKKAKIGIEDKKLKEILKKAKDSKKLSKKQREKIFELIKKSPFIKFSYALVSEKVIDKINIEQATFKAMRICLKKLKIDQKMNRPSLILIDGNRIIGHRLPYPQKAIIKGDDKVFSIALASIVAKVIRDRKMKNLAKKYPQYGFEIHKGYPTKLHLKLLKKYGVCKIHRRTYRPIAKILNYEFQ
ncbi:MAG: ribonuclease HII [Candidatus Paceibacterota bacterium]|jgi:ribonuclease HII|nr:ribonuclease HII [Candidatus Paceibacterota bacterium]MDD3548715.1 ribonuclease HII [Candidatus Paceibacterota bacterium]MDD4999114.1 ribonuclease HII [Candidatus Paceibacterota bacterium]